MNKPAYFIEIQLLIKLFVVINHGTLFLGNNINVLNAAHSGKGWIILVKGLCGTASLWERMIMQEGGKRKKRNLSSLASFFHLT